ncbi:MAG TPA: hypothetical protein VNT60_02150 [Deinococcales bacterium]|nr:hypothetical protein [Deinococcales bacterium]
MTFSHLARGYGLPVLDVRGNGGGREITQRQVVSKGLGEWERRAGSYHVVRVPGPDKEVFFLLTPEEHRDWEYAREHSLETVGA